MTLCIKGYEEKRTQSRPAVTFSREVTVGFCRVNSVQEETDMQPHDETVRSGGRNGGK